MAAGAVIALGTDHNPGTSGLTRMSLVVAPAVGVFKMSAERALRLKPRIVWRDGAQVFASKRVAKYVQSAYKLHLNGRRSEKTHQNPRSKMEEGR